MDNKADLKQWIEAIKVLLYLLSWIIPVGGIAWMVISYFVIMANQMHGVL